MLFASRESPGSSRSRLRCSQQARDIEAVRVVDRAVHFDDADDLESPLVHQLAAMPPTLPNPCMTTRVDAGVQTEALQRLQRDDHAAAAGGFGASQRTAQIRAACR